MCDQAVFKIIRIGMYQNLNLGFYVTRMFSKLDKYGTVHHIYVLVLCSALYTTVFHLGFENVEFSLLI